MANKTIFSVLIVENQPNYTQLLVKQLMFVGLNPVLAITGAGGLRKVAERPPDLILLEVDLSDMDGLEFVATLRQRPEADRIPIIAMSGLPHVKDRCLKEGCNGFLLKPVKMIDLMRQIRKFLPQDTKLSAS